MNRIRSNKNKLYKNDKYNINKKKIRQLKQLQLVTFYARFPVSFFLSIPVITFYYGSVSDFEVVQNISSNNSENNTREEVKALHNVSKRMVQSYKNELTKQQSELDDLKQYNQEMVQSLLLDIAKLKANIIRLDVLGNHLTDVAKLDKKAFNFSTEVAIGGSVDAEDMISRNIYTEFDKRMLQITLDIDNQTKQFNILESLLINDQFKQMMTPAGKPVEKGYISSSFGVRQDPFSGREKMHKGVDVAGKSGSNVLATANGVVTLVENQRGYGQVVDIDHGYGLSTRYGHNKSVLVKAGDIVKQGQIIAIMGSTGRSTGPHVHYEVLKNGHPVNPNKYIITARKN